jgi:hypothetical protein
MAIPQRVDLLYRERRVVLDLQIGISLPTARITWGEVKNRINWYRIVRDRWGRYGEN